jgi:hypothetical protein
VHPVAGLGSREISDMQVQENLELLPLAYRLRKASLLMILETIQSLSAKEINDETRASPAHTSKGPRVNCAVLAAGNMVKWYAQIYANYPLFDKITGVLGYHVCEGKNMTGRRGYRLFLGLSLIRVAI